MSSTKTTSSKVKIFEGCNFFRQRLVLATLSGTPIRITKIRCEDDEPGLVEHETSFLNLINKLTNGSKIEINESGTQVLYVPGLLMGGDVEHECSCQRSLGYYLEGVVPMAPFCKKMLTLTLKGVTNDKRDISVDSIKFVTLALMKRFGVLGEGLDLKINKRGARPDGGGEVVFSCPATRKLKPINLIQPGKFKRIRGTAYCMKVAPSMANRIVDASKKVLTQVLSDVFIYTDHAKGPSAGNSPGFGLSLMVESMSGTMLSVDSCSHARNEENAVTAEDLGTACAYKLLQEIYRGGCVDATHQSLALLYMALGQMDVSKILIGPLTTYTIEFLRHMKEFFNITYKMELERREDDGLQVGGDERYILTCVGIGYANFTKPSI